MQFTKDELKLLGGCVFSKFLQSLDDPSIQHLYPDLKKLRDKIELMIEYLTPEKPKSLCKCGDKYHSNGAICL